MNKFKLSNQTNLIIMSNKVIKIKPSHCAQMLTKAQWIKENPTAVPSQHSDDYCYLVDTQYTEYLKCMRCTVEQHHHEILLSDPKSKKICEVKNILITLQSTFFNGAIRLIIKDSVGEEVSLCEFTELHLNTFTNEHFENSKFDLINYVNMDTLLLEPDKALVLQLFGGVILSDNIYYSALFGISTDEQ